MNPKNTWATSMTVAELKKLWEPAAQGKIMRWSQVRAGWPDSEIHLFGAGVDSGTFDYFTEAIVGKAKASRGDYTSSEDDNVIVQGVSGDEYALGYFGYAYYEENKDKLKLVAVDDGDEANGAGPILPSPETVGNGTYRPLSRPIFIYPKVKSLDRPEVKSFVDFYLKEGVPLVREVGYIPLTDKEYELVRGAVYGARRPASMYQGTDGQSQVTLEQRLSQVAMRRCVRRARSSSSSSSGRCFSARPASILVTAGIVVVLLFETVAFLREVPITEFLFGTVWTPLFSEKHFGVLPLVSGTLLTSLIAMVVALPAGLLTAIYLSEYAAAGVRRIVRPVLEVLAGVPTVVYGYFALQFVTPLLQSFVPGAGRLQRARPRHRDGHHDPAARVVAVGGRAAQRAERPARRRVRARLDAHADVAAGRRAGGVLGDLGRGDSRGVARDRRNDDRRDRRRPAAAADARSARAGRDDDRLHRAGQPGRHAGRHARVPDDLRRRHAAVPQHVRAEPDLELAAQPLPRGVRMIGATRTPDDRLLATLRPAGRCCSRWPRLSALIYDVLHDGLGRLSWAFLTSDPSRRAEEAGISRRSSAASTSSG